MERENQTPLTQAVSGALLRKARGTVKIRKEDLEIIRAFYHTENWDSAIEQSMLAILTSEALMPYDRILFHSAAFKWQGGAYLLAALSGTGKTTQLRHWLSLYGDEIEIINGDKPLLYIPEKGIPYVFPSPWNGKENYGGTAAAPLAGIICLEQGLRNIFEPMTGEKAVDNLFLQFLTFMRTPEQIHTFCRFEERLLRTVPVWKLINTGGLEAAQLAHDRILYCGRDQLRR